MHRSKVVLALVGAALFASGLIVGQEMVGSSKFDKYAKPAYISLMDWALLQAQVRAIGNKIPGEVTPPNIAFDSRNSKVAAVIVVSPSVSKESLDSVRTKLLSDAIATVAVVRAIIPEASETDFEIEFRSWDKKGNFYTLAEYRRGELAFRSR